MQPNQKRITDPSHQTAEGLPGAASGLVAVKTRLLPTGGTKRPAILLSAPTLLGLLDAFRRRWFAAIAGGFLAGAILATAAWFILPGQSYTARTLLRISSLQPIILHETPESRVGSFGDYQRTQMAYVKSRKVLNVALRSDNLRKHDEVQQQMQRELDPITWLEKQIKVDFASSPEIMRISISGTDSKSLPDIVEAVRDAYLAEIVERDYVARKERLIFLETLYQEYEEGLKTKRTNLRTLAAGVGTADPKIVGFKQEFALKEMHTVQSELLQVKSQLRKAQLEFASQPDPEHGGMDPRLFAASMIALVGQPLGNGPLTVSTALLVGRPRVTKLAISAALIDEYMKKDRDHDRHAKHVALLEKRRDALAASTKDPEKEPVYKRTLADLELAKQSLAAYRDEMRPRIFQQVREKYYGDTIGARQSAQLQIEFLTTLEDILEKEVDKRAKSIKVTSEKTLDMEWLKDDIAGFDNIVKKVHGQYHSLKVEILADKRVQKFDDGTSVTEDANPRLKLTGAGFGGGFALVVLGISYIEFRSRKVNKPEELTEGLQLKVLGTMPVISKQGREARRLMAPEANRRFQKYLVDSVDATRLVLLHAARVDSLQVLQTTSAFGGEGKTMLSSHLAVNLATAGYRTLLIDADLRRPAVHKVFHLPNEPGLCDVLRGENLAAVIRPGPVEGLSLLLAGDCKGNPNQLLNRECLTKLLPTLRQQYDYIIVDSAPLLPVVDSQFIAQHVDGVILSVIKNVSRLPAVHAACEKLVTLEVRILGVVVHGATNESYYHDYAFATPQTSTAYGSDSPKT